VEAARGGAVFDDELDVKPWHQDFVEDPDDELVLTDG